MLILVIRVLRFIRIIFFSLGGYVFNVWVGAELVSLATIMWLLVGVGGSGTFRVTIKMGALIKYVYLQILIGRTLLFRLIIRYLRL